jgi:hypothetical protein
MTDFIDDIKEMAMELWTNTHTFYRVDLRRLSPDGKHSKWSRVTIFPHLTDALDYKTRVETHNAAADGHFEYRVVHEAKGFYR